MLRRGASCYGQNMVKDRLLYALDRLTQALARLEEADSRRAANQDIAVRYQRLREATEQALNRIDNLITGNPSDQKDITDSLPTEEEQKIIRDSFIKEKTPLSSVDEQSSTHASPSTPSEVDSQKTSPIRKNPKTVRKSTPKS